MDIKPEDINFDDYKDTRLVVRRSPKIMNIVWQHYLRTNLTLNYTCAAVIAALSDSR